MRTYLKHNKQAYNNNINIYGESSCDTIEAAVSLTIELKIHPFGVEANQLIAKLAKTSFCNLTPGNGCFMMDVEYKHERFLSVFGLLYCSWGIVIIVVLCMVIILGCAGLDKNRGG